MTEITWEPVYAGDDELEGLEEAVRSATGRQVERVPRNKYSWQDAPFVLIRVLVEEGAGEVAAACATAFVLWVQQRLRRRRRDVKALIVGPRGETLRVVTVNRDDSDSVVDSADEAD